MGLMGFFSCRRAETGRAAHRASILGPTRPDLTCRADTAHESLVPWAARFWPDPSV